jgi:hypothetical protein
MPLFTWYDRPAAASTPARTVATKTSPASAAWTTAAARKVGGLCGMFPATS